MAAYTVIIEMPPGDEAATGFMVEKIREVAYPRLLIEFEEANLRQIEDLNRELGSRNCPTVPFPEASYTVMTGEGLTDEVCKLRRRVAALERRAKT